MFILTDGDLLTGAKLLLILRLYTFDIVCMARWLSFYQSKNINHTSLSESQYILVGGTFQVTRGHPTIEIGAQNT